MSHSLHHPLCFKPDIKITSSFSLAIIGISVLRCYEEINRGTKGKEPQKLQSHMATISSPLGTQHSPGALPSTLLCLEPGTTIFQGFFIFPWVLRVFELVFTILIHLLINTSGLSPQLPSTRGFPNPRKKLKLILHKTWLSIETKKAVTKIIFNILAGNKGERGQGLSAWQ